MPSHLPEKKIIENLKANLGNDKNPVRAPKFKHLPLLCMIYLTVSLAAFIVAYKIINIGYLTLSAGILIFPIIYNILDIVTEVYGYPRSRKLLWEAFACQLFFVLSITFIVSLSPAPVFHLQEAYELTLGHLIRFFDAIFLGVLMGSFLNIYVLSKLKIWKEGKQFWKRCLYSSALGQLVVSLVADSIAFIGVYPLSKVITIMSSVYVFKLIYIIAFLPITILTAKYLKFAENIDVYDRNVNFNPFSLKIDYDDIDKNKQL